MTSKLWSVVKDHFGNVVVGIIGVLGTFAFEHWKDLIGSMFHTLWWYYGLPGITLYFVYQLYRFVNGLYQRFTRLEAQVLEDRLNREPRREALVERLQASHAEEIKNIENKIEKTRQELDSQAYEREKHVRNVLREDILARKDLEREVTELKLLVASQAEQIVKLREKLVSPPQPKREITLADCNSQITSAKEPGLIQWAMAQDLTETSQLGLLSLAATPPKRNTNGGSGS